MENVKFSFVMPVYNVEKHLKTAIESVLSQTYKNFELILVDDCSPDNCPAICDEYAAKYENIRCIHHGKNQGLSTARNTGLTAVTGDYVTFTDSDDYIDSDMLESVVASLNENAADSVIFGVKEEYFNKDNVLSKTYELKYGEEKRISSADDLRHELIKLEEKTFLGYVWNKFYKVDIIKKNNLSFEKVTLIEDIIFNLRFFENAASLNILNTTPYHYMKRIDGSLTNKFVKDYYALHYRRVSEILTLYKKWDMCTDDIKRTLGNIYARYIYSALQRNCDSRSGMTNAQRKEFLKSVFDDEMFKEFSPFISVGGYAGVLYNCLKNKQTGLCLMFGKVIYIVKEKLPTVFAAAKQARN